MHFLVWLSPFPYQTCFFNSASSFLYIVAQVRTVLSFRGRSAKSFSKNFNVLVTPISAALFPIFNFSSSVYTRYCWVLSPFSSLLRSAASLCEKRLNSFVRFSNRRRWYSSAQRTVGIREDASLFEILVERHDTFLLLVMWIMNVNGRVMEGYGLYCSVNFSMRIYTCLAPASKLEITSYQIHSIFPCCKNDQKIILFVRERAI